MSSDPVGAAIATAGVPDERADLHSSALAHDTAPSEHILSSSSPGADANANGKGKQRQTRYDSDGDDDDLVVFESGAALPRLAALDGDGDGEDHEQGLGQRPGSLAKIGEGLARASMESLSFGYRDHLLPLSLSAQDADASWEAGDYGDVEGAVSVSDATRRSRRGGSGAHRSRRSLDGSRHQERRVTLLDGIALTVGVQIGSGIFSSPGVVTLNTGSIGASLVVWMLSGVLAWTGASSYAELGASIPLNGGSQAYLNYSFGPGTAFLFTWSALVALKPGAGAIVATIFGEYIARVLYHVTSKDPAHPHEKGLDEIPGWSVKLIACLIALVVTLLNAFSSKLGTRTQIATTSVKLIALAAVPILAIVQAARGKVSTSSAHAFSSIPHLFEGSSTNPSAYALALYSGLWAYDGWDQSCFVAGEMKRVERDLPRVIHSSLSIVIAIFLAAVTSYFVVLPPDLVKRTNTVALDFGSAIFGTTGGVVFAFLVAFSCFGALNGQVYTTARLILAASREGYLPASFGDLNRRTKTPLNALLLQLVLIVMFTVFGSGFASLVNFYGVCSWTFYLATVLGLLVLRIKEPNLQRPYKTWLPTPILFAAVALFLLLMPVVSAPLEALAAFGFILAGVPVYFATQPEARRRIPGLSRLFRSRQAATADSDVVPLSKAARHDDDDDEAGEEAVEMLPRESLAGSAKDAEADGR
ncbi:uncharacterized protein PFL1_06029 [Pseudozyma flocculosa PF-1]|uniref:Related to large neutral amino acid transporter 1 n=2 Tax=Pseudozyma flocculosa TaxID=84751 RepID=A0A5C3F5T7_9BASI|nr:uncharacterized protein PFL1_06029 [Pseudozyma flocculosa PF-1]EPQ26381.1 hypothetical protein PFL1_06029 [Pseudozyma flocculosa PF-1]SPO39027.1 related to large neutral amino acid transporter 1 [Pseudozyma flocculosa]